MKYFLLGTLLGFAIGVWLPFAILLWIASRFYLRWKQQRWFQLIQVLVGGWLFSQAMLNLGKAFGGNF